MRHTGLIHPKFDLKLVLKMGEVESGVLSRFTLRFTREMAVQAQIREKRKTLQEKVFRFVLGSPEGIRTLDLMAENHASWTTRRRGHANGQHPVYRDLPAVSMATGGPGASHIEGKSMLPWQIVKYRLNGC